MSVIRIGIVGCGGNIGKAHALGFKKINTLKLTAACDINLSQAEKYASNFEGQDLFVTTDYRELVDHVDAVLIALPHDLHYESGMFFARNKKHILMEKPLCNTEEECLRLIEVCDEEMVVLMCGYPVRYWEGVEKLKELVDSGEYGKVMNMSIWTEQLTITDELDWPSTARLGGGQFFSHGCHYVDLMMWFLGDPESGTHLGTRIGTPWLLREGTSHCIMKFKNGALGYHFGTWGSRGTRRGGEFEIIMEKATLEYQHNEGWIRLYRQGFGKYEELWTREGLMGKEMHRQMEHFAHCITAGETPLTDGPGALRSLQAIWAMYDAEKTMSIADLSHI